MSRSHHVRQLAESRSSRYGSPSRKPGRARVRASCATSTISRTPSSARRRASASSSPRAGLQLHYLGDAERAGRVAPVRDLRYAPPRRGRDAASSSATRVRGRNGKSNGGRRSTGSSARRSGDADHAPPQDETIRDLGRALRRENASGSRYDELLAGTLRGGEPRMCRTDPLRRSIKPNVSPRSRRGVGVPPRRRVPCRARGRCVAVRDFSRTKRTMGYRTLRVQSARRCVQRACRWGRARRAREPRATYVV